METIKHYGNVAIDTLCKTEAGFYVGLCIVATVGTGFSMGLMALLSAAIGR